MTLVSRHASREKMIMRVTTVKNGKDNDGEAVEDMEQTNRSIPTIFEEHTYRTHVFASLLDIFHREPSSDEILKLHCRITQF
jgi:hypothetical protein